MERAHLLLAAAVTAANDGLQLPLPLLLWLVSITSSPDRRTHETLDSWPAGRPHCKVFSYLDVSM